MKKISLIILIFMLGAITCITIYTLLNKNVKGEVISNRVKDIEKASTNITENELSEVYNIELNGKRHRLKTNYRVTFQDKLANINLTIYLDGFEIFNKDIENNIKATKIEEIFNKENNNKLIIETNDLSIIKEDKDYLAILVKSSIENFKEEYIIINSKGKILLKDILAYEENIHFVDENDNELTIFYDETKQLQAKIEDKKIYSLQKKEKENDICFEEYIYTIKNDTIKKELTNTYNNIKISKNK